MPELERPEERPLWSDPSKAGDDRRPVSLEPTGEPVLTSTSQPEPSREPGLAGDVYGR